jgi:hypothetical protein
MKLLRRVRWSLVGAAAFFLVLAVGAYGWTTQSGYFALLPDNAHPAANVVHAPGGDELKFFAWGRFAPSVPVGHR